MPSTVDPPRTTPAALLAALASGHDREHQADATWCYLTDPRMPALEHGWKLHVSARPDTLARTIELVVPVLLRHVCDAKFAVSAEVLRDLNTGLTDPAAVGKAVTVYPHPDAVRALARELVDALRGQEGPRVVSDRRVDPEAPVHYRYGPFRAVLGRDVSGQAVLSMAGPAGEDFPGLAAREYRQPPWAADPFADPAAPAPAASTPAAPTPAAMDRGVSVGGGRYRITAGIARSAQGSVYRAVDATTGAAVVVKQARAFVGEDVHRVDARGRLRTERGVLERLAGVAGVPRLTDYFRHGEDEYLVMSDCGTTDLHRDVDRHGPYRAPRPGDAAAPGAGRDWNRLATRLLRVLDAVHARGVVVRDLKPANVVTGESGDCHLVDFGVAALDGSSTGGATPGYSQPVWREDAPAEPADDYYALGMTLSYALTGLDPQLIDPDDAVNRERSLMSLGLALPSGERPDARDVVAGLTSFDPAERVAAAAALRARGDDPRPAGLLRVARVPEPPRVTDDLLDAVIDHTVGCCVAAADRVTGGRPRSAIGPEPLTIYDGAAGLGLELLRHTSRPDALRAAADLAAWLRATRLADLPAGLYTGRSGVDLFIALAAAAPRTAGGSGRQGSGAAAVPEPPETPPASAGADQMSGAAGTGTGALLLAGLARSAGDEDAARRHLALAARCREGLIAGVFALDIPRPTATTAAYTHGFAHGSAGVAHFLLAHDRALGEAADAAGRAACAALAAETPAIIAAAAAPGATRRYASWCRGLAGIGAVLVRAADRYDEPAWLDLAVGAARSCLGTAPRMSLVIQCCGLAGVGELLVDVAAATGDEEFWQGAARVARLILARAGGPPRQPVFPGGSPDAASSAWATGSPGVLSFLRRLRERGGPRLLMDAQVY